MTILAIKKTITPDIHWLSAFHIIMNEIAPAE